MSCKFIWFNLPNKINKIYEELSDIKTCTGIEPAKFIWYNLPNKLKALCELVECEETGGGLKIIDLTN